MNLDDVDFNEELKKLKLISDENGEIIVNEVDSQDERFRAILVVFEALGLIRIEWIWNELTVTHFLSVTIKDRYGQK